MPIRTLYIGLGGTGAKSILRTKKCFVDAYGEVPPMVGFLAIDTDTAIEQLEFKSRKGDDVKFDSNEICFCGIHGSAVAIVNHYPAQYQWLPSRNKQFLNNLQGLVRSAKSQESRLVRTATLLAILESGKVALCDTADTNYGIYQMNDTVLKDHNWHKGGYGTLTAKQSLAHSSHIALYKNVRKSFDSVGAYLNAIYSMGYGLPEEMEGLDSLKAYRRFVSHDSSWDDLAFFCTGDKQSIFPIQVLTFINAIANDGRMVRPTLFKREPETIIPMIASQASIDSMQVALRYVITDGLGRRASSEQVEVAGVQGAATISGIHELVEDGDSTEYAVEFCGYFPAEAPKYSIIVSMNKKGFPRSGGGMAGPVFRDIVDYMHQRY